MPRGRSLRDDGLMIRVRAVVAAGVLSLLLGGCSVLWPLAARRGPDGPVVVMPACTTERLVRLDVSEFNGALLWQIRAAAPVVTRSITVGVTPNGFVTDVALERPLVQGVEYEAWAVFEGHGPTAEVRFHLGDLRAGQLFVEGRLRTVADYEQIASSTGLCGAGDFTWTGILWTKFGLGLLLTLIALTAIVVPLVWAHRRRLAAFRRGLGATPE